MSVSRLWCLILLLRSMSNALADVPTRVVAVAGRTGEWDPFALEPPIIAEGVYTVVTNATRGSFLYELTGLPPGSGLFMDLLGIIQVHVSPTRGHGLGFNVLCCMCLGDAVSNRCAGTATHEPYGPAHHASVTIKQSQKVPADALSHPHLVPSNPRSRR